MLRSQLLQKEAMLFLQLEQMLRSILVIQRSPQPEADLPEVLMPLMVERSMLIM